MPSGPIQLFEPEKDEEASAAPDPGKIDLEFFG